MKFTQTIRFKLTLWYSTFLYVLSLVFVVFINGLVTDYYSKEPVIGFPNVIVPHNQFLQDRIQELTDKQREVVEEIRKEDLAQIRTISVLSLIPLSLLSFVGGYTIAGTMLRPIKEINAEIKRMNVENLDRELVYDDSGDEISELVGNFNEMTSRLNRSFIVQKQFIENASHELKTPLAIVSANLDTALLKQGLDKKTREYLETSMKSVGFMNKLIEDLLLLSITERAVDLSKLELREVLEETVSQLKMIALARKVKLDLNLPSEKIEIIGNRVLIQRVIMNLIENAINYSRKGAEVKIACKTGKSKCYILIQDKGIGISEADQEHIFERFYRVDKSRSRETGGTGLGLAIAKKIVEIHSGEILLESKLGEGTLVTLIFNKMR